MLNGLKTKVKHILPQRIQNGVLLTFPFLYRSKLIKYETNLENGIDELITQLDMVIKLDGSIIECGSTYCGTSIIMAKHLRSIHVSKIIYAYDSFEGFDPTELAKERKAGLTEESEKAFKFTSYEYVTRKIKSLGFEGMVVPVKGFFEQTLPNTKGKFCFSLIDCDLRDSIVYCAERIWPNLVSGGRIVIDDYTCQDYKVAKLGVDFFVNKYGDEILEHGLLKRLYFVCKK